MSCKFSSALLLSFLIDDITLAGPQKVFYCYCKILTRPIVLTITHHKPEPGWARGITDLTHALTSRGKEGFWKQKNKETIV